MPNFKGFNGAPKAIYAFDEGDKSMKSLLGGKGANLAEMAGLGLPVPPGFTITTDVCRRFMQGKRLWTKVFEYELWQHMTKLSAATGKNFGDPANPLVVSIRSGAQASMPGMMETILNLGLNDKTVEGLAAQADGDRKFAWRAYTRFVEMFGRVVGGVQDEEYYQAEDKLKKKNEYESGRDFTVEEAMSLVGKYKELYKNKTGKEFPEIPFDQLKAAIEAVFKSWNSGRAQAYRKKNGIPDDWGTACSIVAMIFGNRGMDSGTGVVFTRNPSDGNNIPYGDYLMNAQGEDVVAGIRNTLPFDVLAALNPVAYADLRGYMTQLERHYQDMVDIEFTVERGKLWILQVRAGKRTPVATFVIAADLFREGLIPGEIALARVHEACQAGRVAIGTARLIKEGMTPIAQGLGVSPGIAVGQIVFTSEDAVKSAEQGKAIILVRKETNPDDYTGMIAASGVLTMKGGKNSHAAVVARSEGIPTVCGAGGRLTGDTIDDSLIFGETKIKWGSIVTIDGTTGAVYTEDAREEDGHATE